MPNSSASIDLPESAWRARKSPSSLALFSAAEASDPDSAAGSKLGTVGQGVVVGVTGVDMDVTLLVRWGGRIIPLQALRSVNEMVPLPAIRRSSRPECQ